jgi:hypothetical protein
MFIPTQRAMRRFMKNIAQAGLSQGFTVRILSGTRTFAERRRNHLNQCGNEQADSRKYHHEPYDGSRCSSVMRDRSLASRLNAWQGLELAAAICEREGVSRRSRKQPE